MARWDSRRQRKRGRPTDGADHTWWAPRARGWWIAALFAVGSGLFALGATPGYASLVGARADSITFFVGSIFFTAAAFLQYRESVDAGSDDPPRGWRKVFAYRPRQIDWWACAIQLVGTLYFNVSTGNAVRIDLTAQAARQHVWRPDAVGSICFLVASGLAWFEVCHGWAAWSPASLAWWITGLNLVGSVAFGASAVAAFVVPSTGQIWDAQLSNFGHLRRSAVLPGRRPAADAGADGGPGTAGGPGSGAPGGRGRLNGRGQAGPTGGEEGRPGGDPGSSHPG